MNPEDPKSIQHTLQLLLAAGVLHGLPAVAAPVFSENFDSLAASFVPKVSSSEKDTYDPDGPGPLTPVTGAPVWTATTPAGWTMTKGAAHTSGGPAEFDGWTLVDKWWWVDTEGNQNRNLFTKGQNVVMMADSDAYDDLASGSQTFEATISTPDISLAGRIPNSLVLRFDSSWRAEPQLGSVTVSYDGGPPVTLLSYDGTTPTGYDDTLQLPLHNPAGAASMKISWYHKGTNNWWWAIDNVVVDLVDVIFSSQPVGGAVYEGSPFSLSATTTGAQPATYQWYKGQGGSRVALDGKTAATLSFATTSVADSGYYSVDATAGSTTLGSAEVYLDVQALVPANILFAENFDSAPLGYPVQEGTLVSGAPVVDGVWTAAAPAGWTVNDLEVVGLGDPALGVEEWEGWSFTNPDWWPLCDNQGRSQFTRGGGAIAVADPDEWDDRGNPDSSDASEANLLPGSNLSSVIHYNTEMVSPVIHITGVPENSVKVRFSSSWQAEVPMMAILWVSFDGGPRQKVLHWNCNSADATADDDGIYKPDGFNESLTFQLPNPAGATTMQLTFHMPQADNDWWWAVDNLVVFTGSAPADVLAAPDSRIVLAGGGAVTFQAAPDGIGPFSYAWAGPDGSPLASDEPGDPADRLTVNAPSSADTGNYRLTIANPAGSIQTNARLQLVPFQFELQPADKTGGAAVVGGSTMFLDTVILSYDDTIAYQWYKFVDDDNDPLTPEVKQAIVGAGSTNPNPSMVQVVNGPAGLPGLNRIVVTLSLDNAVPTTTSGRYLVEIANDHGMLSSRTAAVEVKGLVIVDDVDPVVANAGNVATLAVLADSFEPVSYQWYRGRGAGRQMIEGATTPSLEFNPLRPADTGHYSVDVSIGGASPVTLTSREARVTVYVPMAPVTLFEENFDNLPLGPNQDEGLAGTNVWTKSAPAGWTLDDSGVPGVGDGATDGVTEWAGWSFADRAWWTSTAGDQERSQFTKSTGAAMIADPDEWDDQAHTAGSYHAYVSTPDIPLRGAAQDSVVLTFDSSWRWEAPQEASLHVSYDGGTTWTELLHFSSNTASGDFKPDATNETISIPVFNPAGATTARLRFGLFNAGNNWWWAVDNVKLSGEVPLDGFQSWALAEGIADDENGDDDFDGVPALLEYGLGLDPQIFDVLPSLVPSGNDFTLTFAKGAAAAADPKLSYSIETSATMLPGSWAPAGSLVQDATTISATIPGGLSQIFARLRIDRAP